MVSPCGAFTMKLMLGTALAIIIYGKILQKYSTNRETTDPLNSELISIKGKSYSWWPISHFLMHTIIGFFCPCYWKQAFLAGIGWEIFETASSSAPANKHHVVNKADGKLQYTDWWAGSNTDIVINGIGLATGIALGNLYRKQPLWTTDVCPA
jgi:hypothetical protein